MTAPEPRTLGASLADPVREASGLVAGAWARGNARTRVALALGAVVAAALLGAFVFGVWHVLFGGVVKGNWRAGGFGLALATVAGVLLAVEAWMMRWLLG